MLTSSLQVSIFEKAWIQHSIQNFLDVNLSSKVYIHHKHCDFAKKKTCPKKPRAAHDVFKHTGFSGFWVHPVFQVKSEAGWISWFDPGHDWSDHDCFRTYFGMSVRQFELWLGTHLRRRRNHFREPADPEPCRGSDFHLIVNLVPVCVLSYERTFCQM